MKLLEESCGGDWLVWGAALASVLSWQAAMMIVILVAYRLVAERQRRVTLIALMERAPAGTMIVQDGGAGGPAMWVRIGDSGSLFATESVSVDPPTDDHVVR